MVDFDSLKIRALEEVFINIDIFLCSSKKVLHKVKYAFVRLVEQMM